MTTLGIEPGEALDLMLTGASRIVTRHGVRPVTADAIDEYRRNERNPDKRAGQFTARVALGSPPEVVLSRKPLFRGGARSGT